MSYFLAFDRATGAAKWHGECPETQLAHKATAEIGIIPLLRKGLVYDEPSETMLIDLTAALEALLARVEAGAQAATALSPDFAEVIDLTRYAAVLGVEEAMPNLALAAAAAEVDWAAIVEGGAE